MIGHLADIINKGYPFDRIGIQFSGYFTDNAPPSTAACELVKKWNEKYVSPGLRLAVASEFPAFVATNYATCFQFTIMPGLTGGLMAMVQLPARLPRCVITRICSRPMRVCSPWCRPWEGN